MKTPIASLLAMSFAFLPASPALDLRKDPWGIREEIFRVTPIGLPSDQADKRIRKTLKPKTFYRSLGAPCLPRSRNDEEFLADWVNGDAAIRSSFCCLLGNVDGWPSRWIPIVSNQIVGYWGFDADGTLVDVAVYKAPAGP